METPYGYLSLIALLVILGVKLRKSSSLPNLAGSSKIWANWPDRAICKHIGQIWPESTNFTKNQGNCQDAHLRLLLQH